MSDTAGEALPRLDCSEDIGECTSGNFRIAGDTTGTLKTACLTLEERVGDLSSNDRGTEIDVTALLRTATCVFPAGDRFACRLKAKLQPRMLSR